MRCAWICEGCGKRSLDNAGWGVTGDECDLCPSCWKGFQEELAAPRLRGIVSVLETEEGIRGGQGRAPGRLSRSADLLIVGLFVGLAIVGVAVLFSYFRHLG